MNSNVNGDVSIKVVYHDKRLCAKVRKLSLPGKEAFLWKMWTELL